MKAHLHWTRWRISLALLGFLSVAGPAVGSLDPIGRIEGALSMFGRSLDVERIISPQTAAQAARETAKRWRDEAHSSVREDPRSGKVLEVVRPPWWIVSRYRGESLETVQWKDHGTTGAEGVRSMMAVPIPGRLGMAMPMPMAGAGLASKSESDAAPVPKLRPAARLSLSLLAEAQTHDQVRTQIYRSELQPTVLYRRWLSALLAEGFASDAREPLCIKGGLSPTAGCSGLHRSRLQELVWTIAPEGDGSALVVHLLSRTELVSSVSRRPE
jgi:hypothetical protein